MIKQWMVQFGLWLARWGGWTLPDPVYITLPPEVIHTVQTVEVVRDVPKPLYAIPDDVLEAVKQYTKAQQEKYPLMDGETKRARVFRTLMNVFPKTSKRILSYAIEEAVCSDC